MKILIVSFTFPPQVGGVAEVARTQAAGFAARGHEVTVATTFDARRTDADAPTGVKVKQFNITGNFLAGVGYHGAVAAFQEFMAAHPADVILIHAWQTFGPDLAVPVFGRSRARKVMLSHGFDAHLPRLHARFPWGVGEWLRSLPYVWKLPRMMRSFDRLVFLSGHRDAGRFFEG